MPEVAQPIGAVPDDAPKEPLPLDERKVAEVVAVAVARGQIERHEDGGATPSISARKSGFPFASRRDLAVEHRGVRTHRRRDGVASEGQPRRTCPFRLRRRQRPPLTTAIARQPSILSPTGSSNLADSLAELGELRELRVEVFAVIMSGEGRPSGKKVAAGGEPGSDSERVTIFGA